MRFLYISLVLVTVFALFLICYECIGDTRKPIKSDPVKSEPINGEPKLLENEKRYCELSGTLFPLDSSLTGETLLLYLDRYESSRYRATILSKGAFSIRLPYGVYNYVLESKKYGKLSGLVEVNVDKLALELSFTASSSINVEIQSTDSSLRPTRAVLRGGVNLRVEPITLAEEAGLSDYVFFAQLMPGTYELFLFSGERTLERRIEIPRNNKSVLVFVDMAKDSKPSREIRVDGNVVMGKQPASGALVRWQSRQVAGGEFGDGPMVVSWVSSYMDCDSEGRFSLGSNHLNPFSKILFSLPTGQSCLVDLAKLIEPFSIEVQFQSEDAPYCKASFSADGDCVLGAEFKTVDGRDVKSDKDGFVRLAPSEVVEVSLPLWRHNEKHDILDTPPFRRIEFSVSKTANERVVLQSGKDVTRIRLSSELTTSEKRLRVYMQHSFPDKKSPWFSIRLEQQPSDWVGFPKRGTTCYLFFNSNSSEVPNGTIGFFDNSEISRNGHLLIGPGEPMLWQAVRFVSAEGEARRVLKCKAMLFAEEYPNRQSSAFLLGLACIRRTASQGEFVIPLNVPWRLSVNTDVGAFTINPQSLRASLDAILIDTP